MTGRLGTTAIIFLIGCAAWLALQTPESAQTRGNFQAGVPADSKLQVVSSGLPNGLQQIVVVDSEQRAMAVYHVEPTQGKIQLKSVRKFEWDLRMEHFNGQNPLPSELRQVQP